MRKLTLLLSFLIILGTGYGADYFWINGTGNWNDLNSWSLTSGGAPAATLPTATDDVIFDDNSGLTAVDIVSVNVPVVTTNFDFSAVSNTFTFDSPAVVSFEIQGSVFGNTSGVSFTGTWGEITLNALSPGQVISSQGTVWNQSFRVMGQSVSTTDNFNIGTNDLFVDFGGIDLTDDTITCNSFISNTLNARDISISNAQISVTGGYWEVNPTGLVWTSGNSEVLLGDNALVAEFFGGGLAYDTLRSLTADTLRCFGSNSLSLISLMSASQWELENATVLQADSIRAFGACGAPLIITTTGVGANAAIEKTGFQSFTLSSVDITDVDATGTATANVVNATLTNATGWIPVVGGSLYWIGDSGNWNDGLHWSYVSGGTPSGCIPDSTQQVFFDANSFGLPGQSVLVDDTAFFQTMDWTGIAGNQSFLMDSSVYAHGDVTLHADLLIDRNAYGPTFTFKKNASLVTNGAELDAELQVAMHNNVDSVKFEDDVLMSDSSTIALLRGQLHTFGNTVQSGWFQSVDDPLNPTDNRLLELGTSLFEFRRQFYTEGDAGLTLNAGTSHIYIGDTIKYVPETIQFINALRSNGHNFYDVTLNFQKFPNSVQQIVTGDNTFNKLRVVPGSRIFLQQGRNQIVNDSLILFTTCDLPIVLESSDTSATNNVAFLTSVTNQFSCQALTVEQIDATNGVPITTFYSVDSSFNAGWIFDATPATVADLTIDGPFCLGDTTQFTNLSTVQTGNPDDLLSLWYFNDGTTGFWQPAPPPQDSVYITYETDTTQHEFAYAGAITVKLETVNTTNQCKDDTTFQVEIFNPSILMTSTEPDAEICAGDFIEFEALTFSENVLFEFFLNGISQNVPSAIDTLFSSTGLVDGDEVSVLAYQQGCESDTMPSITMTVNDIPTFSYTTTDIDQIICEGDSIGFTATNAFEPSFQYQYLLNGTGITGFADSINTVGLDTLAHNDVVSAIVLDTLGCRDTSDFIFTINPLPTTSLASSAPGNVICDGELITFTGSGADFYEFFVNGVSVQGPSAMDQYTMTPASTDTITVLGSSIAGCDSIAPESYFYIVNPVPSTALMSSDFDNIICSGETVTFTASGAGLYEFFVNGASVQLGSNNTYVTDTLNDGDVVYVEGSLGACVISSASFNMTVLASPTTALTNDDNGDNTICLGTQVTFTASGATNYEYFVDGLSVQGPSTNDVFITSGLINGQEITVVGESNGCLVQQSQVFNVLNNPNVGFFSDDLDNIICDGDAIDFIGANAGSYEFFVNGSSVQGPSVLTTLSNPILNIGTNQVQVVGIAGNGCTDTSAIIDVTVNEIPVITLTSSDANNIICANEQVTFTGSGGDMYQFFIGATPQGAMSPTNSFSTSNLLNGQTVTITGSLLGCPSTSNGITTTVNPIPTTSLTSTDVNNVYCEADLVDYTAGGATNYEFFVNGASQGAPSTVNTINSSGFPTGTFPVEVVGETNNCFDTTTLSVTINLNPVANLTNSASGNTICDGETVIYTATGGSVYQFFVNGVSQGAPTVNNNLPLTGLANGDIVSVTTASPQGCTNSFAMLPITVNPVPVTTLLSSEPNQEICTGDNVDFTASGASEYEFFINGISQGPPGTNPVFSTSLLSNGDNITVVGTQLGCSSTSNNLNFAVFGYPVVSLVNNGDLEICVGENTDLSALGATNYQFLINSVPAGPFSPVNTFTAPLSNGDVITVIGETNGCQSNAQDSYSFVVNTFPTINCFVTPATTICLGDTVTVNSSGASEYQFDINGEIQQSGASMSFETDELEDGDVINVTGFNGDCPSAPESFDFVVNTMNLDMTVSPSSMICEGDPVTFTATGADEYEFLLNAGVVSPMSANNTFTSSNIQDLDEITFVGFNNTTQCTQKYDDYILMNVPDAPEIAPLSGTTFCEGDSVILLSNGTYGNQWFLDGQPIAGATDTQYVAYASGTYSLDITSGGMGDVWSFGQNATGSFGNGNNFNSSDPSAAITSVQFDEISAGEGFVLGISTTGSLYAWGENNSGQLGDGSYTATNLPQVVPTMTGIKTVATSQQSVMAVTHAGEVYVWGNNTQGQLGTGNTAVINFPFLNNALNNTDTIAAGENHFIILKNDGTVWTVGNNDFGQLGVGTLTSSNMPVQIPGLANVQEVGAGDFHSFAILSTGELLVWGNNASGQLGLGDLNNRLVPTASHLEEIVQAEGGASHSVFLSSENKVYASGGNSFGQLGVGTQNNHLIPQTVPVTGVEDISAGQFTTLILRKDRSVFGFGNNTEDQLSSVNGNVISSPEHISDLDGVTFIEAGKYVSHVIYNEERLCTSAPIDVVMNTIPVATITATDDTLSTISGVSYQWYFEGNPIPGANNQTYPANESGNYSVQVTLANGCISVSDLYYHSMSSLESLLSDHVRVYPNPSNGLFKAELGELQADLTVFDISGKVVWEKSDLSGTAFIDLSDLESAMYLLYISSTEGLLLKKLIRK